MASSQTQTQARTSFAPDTASRLYRRTSSTHSQKKPWQSPSRHRRPSFRSGQSRVRHDPEEEERLSRQTSRQSTKTKPRQPKWWKIRLFRGMVDDVKRRAPFYLSDWTDAWDYRVVPATVYMYFANILPALAFSLDMFVKTNNSFGVNEVLLASVLGCVVFSLLAAQPLVIVGVTGPITVFSYTVYDIVVPQGTNFFAFMAWVGIWSMIMHWILAITNSCNALTYVTRFSCDIFGFYVAFIYLQKGIQVLTRQWHMNGATSAYLSVMVALLVLLFAYGCGIVGESKLFPRHLRKFIEDYGTPLTIIFFTGFVHYGHMKNVSVSTLPVSKSFFPTVDRGWLVDFWNLSVGEIFLAIPFAVLLTILFYFDHNVSSLIAQGTEFPLRKPPGFHWDIFLLGITTGVAGILGIPFPNGLIPQAPFHTNALCVTRQVIKKSSAASPSPTAQGRQDLDFKKSDDSVPTSADIQIVRVVDHVVEQRVSNLAQGLLFLVTMTGPLLIVLHLIPQAVLAGLFFVMGMQALTANGITAKLMYLFRDRELTDKTTEPLARLERQRAVWMFVAIELVGFAATFAITQTIAAIGFPVIIGFLIPIRTFAMPRWFRDEELKALDAPTAGPFVMESVGGAYGVDNDVDDDDDDGPEQSGRASPVVDEMAIIEDSDLAERGQSFEMRRLPGEEGGGGGPTRRSHSAMQRPEGGARRRRSSVSSRGRGLGRPE